MDDLPFEVKENGEELVVTVETKSAFSIGFHYLNVDLDITVLEKLYEKLEVESVSGDVQMDVDKEPASCSVDFKSVYGDGSINMKMNYDTKSDKEIRGTIGSGDTELKARTTSGDFTFHVK